MKQKKGSFRKRKAASKLLAPATPVSAAARLSGTPGPQSIPPRSAARRSTVGRELCCPPPVRALPAHRGSRRPTLDYTVLTARPPAGKGGGKEGCMKGLGGEVIPKAACAPCSSGRRDRGVFELRCCLCLHRSSRAARDRTSLCIGLWARASRCGLDAVGARGKHQRACPFQAELARVPARHGPRPWPACRPARRA
jgi:hypothetical protein